MPSRPVVRVFVAAVALFLAACTSLPLGQYSLDAYKNATTLKAETLAVLAKGAEPYTRHQAAIEALTVKIDAAYEFAAGQPNNQLSAQQWAILRAPDGNLYGGFVRLWRTNGTVAPYFVTEQRAQIGAAFDQIICLEANKQRPTACSSS